jgi:hypothetical protein
MERHTTTMRAARYLLGAGTFAAAMVAMTGSASAQTNVCYDGGEGDPTVCGHVFTDATGGTDNKFDGGEGVPDVQVAITNAAGDNIANSPTPSGSNCPDPIFCGYYAFVVPDAVSGSEYWVCLISDLNNDGVIDDAEDDCRDTTLHPESVKVTVGTSLPFVDFEVGDDGGEEEPPSDIWGVGTGTPGYWKNHPEAWPAEGIVVGGVTYLNQQTAVAPNKTIWDAIKLMGKVGGDKTVSMFAALISAKLNATLANNTACIVDTIKKADDWMKVHPVGSGVKASSPAWSVEGADAWHTLLDDYNNGKLCAPHRQ